MILKQHYLIFSFFTESLLRTFIDLVLGTKVSQSEQLTAEQILLILFSDYSVFIKMKRKITNDKLWLLNRN